MKRFVILFLVLLPNIIGAQISKGTWFWNSDNENESLELNVERVDNRTIKGNYCSVFHNGGKIDCSSELENVTNFILSEISKNTYQGTFTSNFSSTNGILKIIFNPLNNKILLEIVEAPKGEYYLPKIAVLSQ